MDKGKPIIATRPTLGKGLASLIPGASFSKGVISSSAMAGVPQTTNNVEQTSVENKDRHPGISLCSLDDIYPNPSQPRKIFSDDSIQELAISIKENGLIQPIVVRKTTRGYELIAGERRWRASKIAGLKQVPIVIRRTTDRESLELAIIENIQREDLNCVDTAMAYQRLMSEFGLTQEMLSEKVGKDRAIIANHLRLLRMDHEVLDLLRDKKISYAHGRVLASVESAAKAKELARRVVDDGLSVKALEEIVSTGKAESTSVIKNTKPQTELDLRIKNLSKEISNRLGLNSKIKGNDSKGKIVIDYFSRQELDNLLEKLLK